MIKPVEQVQCLYPRCPSQEPFGAFAEAGHSPTCISSSRTESTFCSLPVLHIHEISLQHFWQELAKETLLAFHCEPALKVKSMGQEISTLPPVRSFAGTFASLSNCVLIHKINKAVAFLLPCGGVENMDRPKHRAILGKMLPQLLLL